MCAPATISEKAVILSTAVCSSRWVGMRQGHWRLACGWRALLSLMVTLCAGTLVGASGRAKPNIVVIMADDLGYADIGCYGSTRNRTPHLDRLAREGMRFTDFHASGPGCSPTRAALMTGLYPQRVDIEPALPINHPGLAVWRGLTLPERLKQAGYVTALYGKWHLGDLRQSHPMQHGFDDFEGHISSETDYKSHVARDGKYDWWRKTEKVPNSSYNTDVITERAVEFIHANAERPFFLLVAHSAIHFPWMTPMDPVYRTEGMNMLEGLRKLGPRPTQADVSDVVRQMVESLDASTGRVIEALHERRLDDRTIVIFTSDNGGYIHYQGHHHGQISDNGIYRGQKAQVYEGGHRVPFIVSWPGRIHGGQVNNELVLTMDLVPTLLTLAGADHSAADFDGVDMADLFTYNVPQFAERCVYWRMGKGAAVRRGDWKLVRQGAELQLYNLRSDPRESTDLSKHFPQLVSELNQNLVGWERDVSSVRAQ